MSSPCATFCTWQQIQHSPPKACLDFKNGQSTGGRSMAGSRLFLQGRSTRDMRSWTCCLRNDVSAMLAAISDGQFQAGLLNSKVRLPSLKTLLTSSPLDCAHSNPNLSTPVALPLKKKTYCACVLGDRVRRV